MSWVFELLARNQSRRGGEEGKEGEDGEAHLALRGGGEEWISTMKLLIPNVPR